MFYDIRRKKHHNDISELSNLRTNIYNRQVTNNVKNSLKNDLSYLPARLLLGKILLQTGNLQSAEKELEQAKKLHADSYAVTISLVEVKLLLDKYDEALNLLTRLGGFLFLTK